MSAWYLVGVSHLSFVSRTGVLEDFQAPRAHWDAGPATHQDVPMSGWCVADTLPPVSTGADRDLQLQPGRTQLLGDIFGEIQKPLVRKQLSFGKWDVKGAMTGQARRVLRLQTTAAVFASIAHGSSQAAWFASEARVWLRSGHGANSAISPS